MKLLLSTQCSPGSLVLPGRWTTTRWSSTKTQGKQDKYPGCMDICIMDMLKSSTNSTIGPLGYQADVPVGKEALSSGPSQLHSFRSQLRAYTWPEWSLLFQGQPISKQLKLVCLFELVINLEGWGWRGAIHQALLSPTLPCHLCAWIPVVIMVASLGPVSTLTKRIIFFSKNFNFKFFWNYWNFHDLLWYCHMNSEIIQSVAYRNYDGFNMSTSYFHKNSFHYFEDYLLTKLT
jgi:hypothetical protein